MTTARILLLLAASLAAVPSVVRAADGIVVGYRDVVEPDAELVTFGERVAGLWIGSANRDFAAIDRLFAPSVQTFMKNETPFLPFEPRDDITSDYLRNSVFTLQAKAGSLSAEELSDYRKDAMADIAGQIVQPYPWGTLPEAPGMFCKGAAFDVDQRAVRLFSRMHNKRIDALVFYDKPIALHADRSENSPVVATVPERTLMTSDKHDEAAAIWHPMIVSNGVRGYMHESMSGQTLAQKHVCFAKVDGAYRITALFGYGF